MNIAVAMHRNVWTDVRLVIRAAGAAASACLLPRQDISSSEADHQVSRLPPVAKESDRLCQRSFLR